MFLKYFGYNPVNNVKKNSHKLCKRVVVLIPAHNEEKSIINTILAQLEQTRIADKIVVISDNSVDDTFVLACQFPITVTKTSNNKQKKSGALNWAWGKYAKSADIVVCLDADTVLPPNAIEDWIAEFNSDPCLGGSSSKFTMLGNSTIVKIQKAEFSEWTMTSLRRGWTSVLAGTGCAIRNEALRQVALRDDRDGPWSHDSVVEDFELTYRIRELGYFCKVSETVRAYTDAMKTIRSLWAQRMKWQVGTVDDLIKLGFNRLTYIDWLQQFLGLNAAFLRIIWASLLILMAAHVTSLSNDLIWFIFPLIFIISDVIKAYLVPHRDSKDILLAAMLLPREVFAWLRAGWFLASWYEVVVSKITKQKKDRWSLQYAAEGETL